MLYYIFALNSQTYSVEWEGAWRLAFFTTDVSIELLFSTFWCLFAPWSLYYPVPVPDSAKMLNGAGYRNRIFYLLVILPF